MAIQSGAGARFFVDEFNMSGTTAALTRLLMEQGQQNTTTIQDEAMRRTATLRSGAIDWQSLFDKEAGGSHPVLSTMPTADRLVSYHHRATLGAPAWMTVAKQTTFQPNVSNGELTIDVATIANQYGVELGHSLTAGLVNSTGAEALTGFDDQETATTTNFGLQAFVHVVSFTGTSVDISIQDSDDDAATDAYADVTGATFTTVTGVGTERIATGRTQAVKRWLRIDLAGTYSNLDVVVGVVRNTEATAF